MKWFQIMMAGAVFSSVAYGQSVLPNGNFEQADPANPLKPAGWDAMDGVGVQWTTAADPSHGKAIRMDTAMSELAYVESCQKAGVLQWVFPQPKKNPIAETYGMSLYSAPVPVEAGKAYRVSFDYMSEKGTEGKLWFRGYSEAGERLKRIYEGVLESKSPGKWQRFSGVFYPTKHRPVTQFKVMLFAYYPPGVSWFDNVAVEKVETPDAPAVPPSN